MSEDDYDSDLSIASDYGLLKKALPFECVVSKDFDPNKVPQTAEEFLQYAAYERSQTKPWVSAIIDPSKLTKHPTKIIIEDLDNSVDPKFLPSQEWQKQKLDEFIEFRNFIQPRMKITAIDVFSIKEGINLISERPKYSELILFSQADKIRVLEVVIDYLSSLETGTCFNSNTGSWIYAILTLLDVPLVADYCHVVRLLAKKCIILRSNFKAAVKEKYYPLNLFICIVSKFFGQLDLSDP